MESLSRKTLLKTSLLLQLPPLLRRELFPQLGRHGCRIEAEAASIAALAGAGGGISPQGGVAEITDGSDWLVRCGMASSGRWFRFTKQVALQGQFRLGFSGSRHGPDCGNQIVGASEAADQLNVL